MMKKKKNTIIKSLTVLFLNLFLQLLFVGTSFGQEPESPVDTSNYSTWVQHIETTFSKGDFQEATNITLQLLPEIVRLFGEQSEEHGDFLDMSGVLLHHVGKLQEARSYLEEGVTHAEINQPNKPDVVGIRLNNLGMLLKDMGELGEAIQCLQRAFDVGKRVWSEESPEYGTITNNLAIVYGILGQKDKALDYAYRSLASTQKALGKQHLKYIFRLANIANILQNAGRVDEALDIYPEMVQLFEDIDRKQHLLYAVTLRNWGRAYVQLNDFEKALPLLVTARDSILNKYSDTHPQYIRVMSSLGWVQFKLGQYPKAEASLTEAYHFYQQQKKMDNSSQLLLLRRLAKFHEQQGDLIQTSTYYLEVAQNINRIINYELIQFSEWEQISWMEKLRMAHDELLSYVYRHPSERAVMDAAVDLSFQFKQLTLGYQRALLARVSQSKDPELIATFEEWKSTKAKLGAALSLSQNNQPDDVAQMKESVNLLERKLAHSSYDFSQAQTPISWQDIKQALTPQSVAVDFISFSYTDEENNVLDSILYAAWLIQPDANSPVLVPLFEEKEVGNRRQIRQLYAYNAEPGRKNWRQLLWQPLQDYLTDNKTIYIAPHGVLHLVNIGAIPITENQLLSDHFDLYQMGNLRQLVLEPINKTTETKQALVMGGLRYGASADTLTTAFISQEESSDEIVSFRTLTGRDWEYLKWSAEEAKVVATNLENANWTVSLDTEYKGTEARFKELCQADMSPSLIHLATHAFYFSRPKNDASLVGFKVSTNPLLRSGLILSGANAAWLGEQMKGKEQDGILTAYEVAQLDLQETELVILSACNTAQGAIIDNEGIFGLQRAFKAAGVKYILMSLWSVDDQKTYEFMELFYQYWLEDERSIPAAYQAAQQGMRSKYALPFNPQAWAGFILVE